MVDGMAHELKEAGYGRLAWLLAQRPQQGDCVLVAGARYFFHRAIEEDPKLFQGLTFSAANSERGTAVHFLASALPPTWPR